MERNINIIKNKTYLNLDEKRVKVNLSISYISETFERPIEEIKGILNEQFSRGLVIVRNREEVCGGVPKNEDLIGITKKCEIDKDLKIIAIVEPRIETGLFDNFSLYTYVTVLLKEGEFENFIIEGFYLAGPESLINLSRYEGKKEVLRTDLP